MAKKPTAKAEGRPQGQGGTPPVHVIRLGNVKASIWANDGQYGTMYSVSAERRYRNDQGEWHSTKSFGRDDLLLWSKAIDLAHTWIMRTEAANRQAEGDGE